MRHLLILTARAPVGDANTKTGEMPLGFRSLGVIANLDGPFQQGEPINRLV
jgi:hypothetical protein